MNRDLRRCAASAHPRRSVVAILIGVTVLLCFHHLPAGAQTGGGYDLTWSSIDNGVEASGSAQGYVLAGSIGQPDAGVERSASATENGYTLTGGFWALAQYRAFMPITILN